MKLYMHPASNASRPVMLFMAEKKIDCEQKVVDLMKGEHYSEWYTAINPNRQVPTLEDGDFRLTESSAILKYLASKIEAPEYPTKDLKKRAKVDEAMDWFNTGFYRDFGYGLAYPQLFPHHKRPTDDIHDGVIAWGKDKADVTVTWPDGGTRVISFRAGLPAASNGQSGFRFTPTPFPSWEKAASLEPSCTNFPPSR